VRLLVVEDEHDLAEAIALGLRREGYAVDVAHDGEEALVKAAVYPYDLVCLDLNLPGVEGREVCRRLRTAERHDDEPGPRVLMLTARDAPGDRAAGLDDGADDYLVKPFDLGELKARLRALLRRTTGVDDLDSPAFAELRLDTARHGVTVGERFAELTRTEFLLLELMMLNPRRVLTHSQIYERVWGYDFGPASNALRVYIGYLRRKLQEAGARDLIHTVRGVGYALREP
jgi:two-component system response regulator MprA